MLAFVGDANDGLPDRGCVPSFLTGMRLGVVGASTGTDAVGDVLRRFRGVASIVGVIKQIVRLPCSRMKVARKGLL